LNLGTKTFHPNGAAGVHFREKYAFAERDEYVRRVKGWMEEGKLAIVHGFRGTGKSSVAVSLKLACKSSYLPLYLDFSDIVIGNPSNVFWLDMIDLVLRAYKSQDPGAAERCDEFMRVCKSDDDKNIFRGPSTFVDLFRKTSKLFLGLGKPVVIIGDEFSKFYDRKDESPQATANVEGFVGALRSIKEGGAHGTTRVQGTAMFGTFSATLLRSGSASPFNVVDKSSIPLLTLEEWRACVAQTAWRPDDWVLERMWELTRGYPSVLQTIARDASETRRIITEADFSEYERVVLVRVTLSNDSIHSNVDILKTPSMTSERASLITTFLPAEAPVETSTDTSLQQKAERLTSLGLSPFEWIGPLPGRHLRPQKEGRKGSPRR
jgi:energy-coupling factor transporter ATP-binding protein EcfA2